MKIQLCQPQAINELGGRKNQEDSIYPLMGTATPNQRVFLVCDGMGGLDKGEVASEAVSQAIGHLAESICGQAAVFADADFERCLQQAYDALDAADVKNEATMGTTMTFICFHSGGCLVAHIGDSRIYHLRPSLGPDKGVLYRSRDHSLVQQLYELGEISYNEMGTSSRKNIILKAMQPHQDTRTKATLAHITDVKPGDYFYLCTDGMLEHMEDDELMSIVANDSMTDEQKRQRLIDITVGNGDNHSAYLLRVKDVEHEPGDEHLPSDEKKLRDRNKALNDRHKDRAWSEEDSEEVAPRMPQQRPSAPATQVPTPRTPNFQSAARRTPRPQRPVTPKSNTTLLAFVLSAVMLFVGIVVGVLMFIWNPFTK